MRGGGAEGRFPPFMRWCILSNRKIPKSSWYLFTMIILLKKWPIPVSIRNFHITIQIYDTNRQSEVATFYFPFTKQINVLLMSKKWSSFIEGIVWAKVELTLISVTNWLYNDAVNSLFNSSVEKTHLNRKKALFQFLHERYTSSGRGPWSSGYGKSLMF